MALPKRISSVVILMAVLRQEEDSHQEEEYKLTSWGIRCGAPESPEYSNDMCWTVAVPGENPIAYCRLIKVWEITIMSAVNLDGAMETWVLIPQELSLAITPEKDRMKGNVTVFSKVRVAQGTFFYPFQGTIRLDKFEVNSYLDDSDVRYCYGCYDEISATKERHCNWVRFLRTSPTYSEDVNVIGTRVKGEPLFEVVKNIPANTELVVFFLPERQEEVFFMPAVNYLRNSLYRRTMDTILEDSPLDLSTSLLSRVMIPSPGSTSSSPPSYGGDTDERKSPVTSSETSSNAGDLLDNLRHSTHSQVLNEALNLRHSGSEVFNEYPVDGWKPRPNFHSPTPVFRTSDVLLRRQQKIRSQRGERNLLPCEVCGKAFDRPSLLKRHMRTHTGEKPHVCMVCNKGFSTSSSLNTHRRIHSGEKPHQCQVCGKRFTASSNLYYHRMTHIKEKPHKCTLCAKSFPTPGDLKSHMYVHNGSWPFKCHICNRGFSKHTNLKNHLFLHTGDKPHSCELCHKKFALACNLRAHMKTHEGDPQEECVRCGKVYLSSSNQITHGFCTACYASNQGLPLIKESPKPMIHDSGSEGPHSPLPDEEDIE